MANIKSAKKRISTIDRRTAENKYIKATISTYTKKLKNMIAEGKIEEADKFSKEVYAYIDSACSKGVLHRNNASRKVGRLAAMLYKAKSTTPATTEVKEEVKAEKVEEKTEVKSEEKVEAPKKTTRKTSTKKADEEKKPAEKKTTEKKTAEKKTTTKKATKKAE